MYIYNHLRILISSVIELPNNEIHKALDNNSDVCKYYNKNELVELNDCCMYEKLFEDEYDYIHPCFDLDDKDTPYNMNTKEELAEVLFEKLIPDFFIYVSKQSNMEIINLELGNEFITKNIAISISDDPNKLSIHANYPNIIVTREFMNYIIKTYFSEWINKISSDNKYYVYKKFLNFVDVGIYKKNMSLRAVNSFKPDGKGRLNIFKNTNKLHHYFSYIEYNKNINITLNRKKELQIMSSNNIKISSASIENEEEIIMFIKQIIKNPCIIESSISYNTHHAVEVQYENDCALCGKEFHKNKHMLIIKEDGKFTIYKTGNKTNCKSYTNVLEFNKTKKDIISSCADYILSLDVLYKTNKDLYIGWNGLRWLPLEVRDKTETRYSIERFIFELRNKLPEEYFELIDKNDSRTMSLINRIKLSIVIKNINRFEQSLFIPFNNGVYNISTGNFITGLRAKKFMLYETMDRDYNEVEDETIKDELYSMLNIVQPDTEENHDNKIRFEKCLASTIAFRDKRINHIFIGMTKSGKTFIKTLLLNALGSTLADKCEANSFIESSSSGPNHEIANTANKTLVCISELKQGFKLSSQIFKKITEPTIAARRNYSTEVVNQINNVATHIFDCNSVIDFTEHTASVYERICTIFFNVRFITSDEDDEIIGDDRPAYKADPELNAKIVSGRYNDEFFRYLSALYRKHFKDSFKIEHYCHPSLPIAKTIEICTKELINTNYLSVELTNLIKDSSFNKNLQFVLHNKRLKIFSCRLYLGNTLVEKFEDINSESNEKYKNLKIYNISSYFNELGAINRIFMMLKSDYEDILDSITDRKIVERQMAFMNNALEEKNSKKLKNKKI